MAEAARDALGVKQLEVVSDRGYYNIEQLQRCQEQGVIAYVPAPRPASVAGDGSYPDESFRYDAESDQFICPHDKHEWLGQQSDFSAEDVLSDLDVVVCPICWYQFREVLPYNFWHRTGGHKILVDKFTYKMAKPRRWTCD